MHASQEQSTTEKQESPRSKGDDPPIRRGKLNLLFPLSAILSFAFILTTLVVANPISHEFDGPFVRLMKANGMWLMALEVIAIIASGVGAMWLESRSAPPEVKPPLSPPESKSSLD